MPHLPWIELTVLTPLAGGLWLVLSRQSDDRARRACVLFSAVTLLFAAGAVLQYVSSGSAVIPESAELLNRLLGKNSFALDGLSAPLLPLTALLFLLTSLATLKTKIKRFSFGWNLITESLVLAKFSCIDPWLLIALLIAGTLPPYLELLRRRVNSRIYAIHMLLFALLLIVGWSFAEPAGQHQDQVLWAVVPLLGSMLIRAGILPTHVWVVDLFEKATFGTALLFVTPITAAYATVRLVLPICPTWVLQSIALVSLATAVYAAGMALVQREARRLFAYLFLSHSALIFVGLECASALGVTAALCMWLSVSLSLGGFGLTLRALEARRGRLDMTLHQGVYEHTPALAVCFLLTGLASVGFPATFGFMGTELLVDSAVQVFPQIGIAVVIAAALNGISIMRAYFRLFTGRRYQSSIALAIGPRERFAVLTLAAIILGFGIWPQPIVRSRYEAASALIHERSATGVSPAAQEAE